MRRDRTSLWRHSGLRTAGLFIVAMLTGAALGGCSLRDALRFRDAVEQENLAAQRHGEQVRDIARTCGLCHGLEGRSVGQFYPSLAGQPQRYLKSQLDAFASGARVSAQMQPLALSLSEEDRSAISSYYASLPPSPNATFRARQPDHSKAPELVAACVPCHGPSYEGRPMLGPRLAGQARDYLVRQLAAFRAGARRDPGGSMAAVTRALCDEDIDALADYLAAR